MVKKTTNKTGTSVNPSYFFFDCAQNPCEEPSLVQF